MSQSLSITRTRLERLADERARTESNIEDMRKAAEDEQRDLNELEMEQVTKWRTRITDLDDEINVLAEDIERAENSRDVSKLLRVNEPAPSEQTVHTTNGNVVYRTFAAYARDQIITRFPQIASQVNGPDRAQEVIAQAQENLHRVVNTLSSNVAGLLPPQHITQIMDLIQASRPVVASARGVDLSRGSLTYPKIDQRPEVLKQGSEKTEAGTANMQISMKTLNADTYLGGGDLSWQTINWSSPDALQLWFNLAAEAYARQTETAACTTLQNTGGGTVSPALGTAGTEDFSAWSAAVLKGLGSIYTSTGGRARTDTLYVSASRFFQLAGLSTNNTLQISGVGNLDIGAMTGTFRGLRVVGSYGFSNANAAILGDASAFLVGETPGAPVEMRAVEPTIGGMEVGVIGAFASVVFDTSRFIHLT